jgi:hypothetical protein
VVDHDHRRAVLPGDGLELAGLHLAPSQIIP